METALTILIRMVVIQERSSTDVSEVAYTRGWDLSGSLEGTRSIYSGYHADGNGNITAQAFTANCKYDSYRNLIS